VKKPVKTKSKPRLEIGRLQLRRTCSHVNLEVCGPMARALRAKTFRTVTDIKYARSILLVGISCGKAPNEQLLSYCPWCKCELFAWSMCSSTNPIFSK
jgi:hypothetical protein